MRIYPAVDEENLRARSLLADWVADGLLTQTQHDELKQEIASDLRTTNIYLRGILFFFTLIVVGALAGLFFVVFLSRPSQLAIGVVLFIFAAACYAAAEVAASRAHLYRYGIEEALALCSVGFLCAAIELITETSSNSFHASQVLVLACGCCFSLWVWRRFGLWYAFVAAMIFAVFLPGQWTPSNAMQRGTLAALYSLALLGIMAARSRHHFDSTEQEYSLAEALLWLGIYLALNLQVTSLNAIEPWIGHTLAPDVPKAFYWTTWVLIWFLPPMVLVGGVRKKDRFIMAAGTIAALLTFISNKPYLGWRRYSWDPMILGVVLTACALFLRRWLARGPNGVRHGFTAARLSAKDKQWMGTGSAILGLISQPVVASNAPPEPKEFQFGGGSFGGGGASSEF